MLPAQHDVDDNNIYEMIDCYIHISADALQLSSGSVHNKITFFHSFNMRHILLSSNIVQNVILSIFKI